MEKEEIDHYINQQHQHINSDVLKLIKKMKLTIPEIRPIEEEGKRWRAKAFKDPDLAA